MDLIDSITAAYTKGDRAYETDEEVIVEPQTQGKEALYLLQRHRLYEEEQGGATGS